MSKVWNNAEIAFKHKLSSDRIRILSTVKKCIVTMSNANIMISINTYSKVLTINRNGIVDTHTITDYDRQYSIPSSVITNISGDASDILLLSDNLSQKLTVYTSDYVHQLRKYIKAKDSNYWVSTDILRDSGVVDKNSCNCTTTYRFLDTEKTICVNANLHLQSILQYSDKCGTYVDFDPPIYAIGKLLTTESTECGTVDYKEVPIEMCGQEANDKYSNLPKLMPYTKYKIYMPYVSNDGLWQPIQCGKYVKAEVLIANSFECGWSHTEGMYEFDNNICGSEVKNKYPTLANKVEDTRKYDIKYYKQHTTLPYPQNTDDMPQEEWKYGEYKITSPTIYRKYGYDCECGYKHYEWRNSGNFICGSEIGEGYVATSSYEVWEKWETCSNTKTGEKDFRNPIKSCECGYRIYGYKIDETIGYEYVCGDDIKKDVGYMYYKEYKYEQCEDGSNFKWDKNDIRYTKASHSTDYECIYDPDTKANTTKQTYRTFYNENTNAYETVLCPIKIILSTEKKSSDCGYSYKWEKIDEICCGELVETETPTLTITRVEGDWIREGNKFTSNKIYDGQETIERVYFKANQSLLIEFDQSSEINYDYGYIYRLDDERNYIDLEGKTRGKYLFGIPYGFQEEHYIKLKYKKDTSTSKGRDNVIITFSPMKREYECTQYSKYNLDEYKYTTDGGDTWYSMTPPLYRYGDIIEYDSESCGYIPRLVQWKLICPNITYETAQEGDGCVICENYNGAPTMYAIEKEQYSTDAGQNWIDTTPLKTRTEKILKWKAEKCGYSGDTFETRYTNEVCENGNLYGDSTQFVSSDGGNTWREIPNTLKTHVLMEENSDKCKENPPQP